jgi:hypothetical protein
MNRRTFLGAALATAGLGRFAKATAAEPTTSPPAASPLPQFTAGSPPGPVLTGSPVVSGPAGDAITILHPLQRHATGYLEYAVADDAWQRVDAMTAGLLPFEQHVLKFRLPSLPASREVRYRITARSIGWVPVREFVYGKIEPGPFETSPTYTFRTVDPTADTTRFVVWNDTHENPATLKALHERTAKLQPDFLLWNGDQSNDIHLPQKMTAQFLAPNGLAIADRWPLAYVRGNHDVRGPAARHLPRFTGTPGDRFYYAFRSGPLAALVMDTGEDKDDDSPWLGGITAFAAMRKEQTIWLERAIQAPWFRSAPFRLLFCHIPLWFTRELNAEWNEYSKPCRNAWLPALSAAGVKLVVSGHTHRFTWMPAKSDQPISQLIGGGPQPDRATLIHATANSNRLAITVEKTDGTVLQEIELKA